MSKPKKSDIELTVGESKPSNVVIECLDAGCTEYIVIEKDGTRRLVIQPKDKCSMDNVPKDFHEQFARVVAGTRETTYASSHLFNNIKIGTELKL